MILSLKGKLYERDNTLLIFYCPQQEQTQIARASIGHEYTIIPQVTYRQAKKGLDQMRSHKLESCKHIVVSDVSRENPLYARETKRTKRKRRKTRL